MLFILAAESSGDVHGAALIEELLRLRPNLKIAAVGGPRMRSLPIQVLFPMERLQVMGFIDVVAALPRIAQQFFVIRRAILSLNPKAVVCIDYPGFNLRLETSLRKKGYRGQLIHYICPTIWAWGKKRIPKMAKTLDLLLTLFPFEKKYFSSTHLPVAYVGHPLIAQIPPPPASSEKKKILGLFPGSRQAEVLRNFPLQLAAAKKLAALDHTLEIAVSVADKNLEPLMRAQSIDTEITFYPFEQNYEFMKQTKVAIATSGTITLELALHTVPTIVNFAIHPIDLFLAQKIFRINLPFYCIVNIILSKQIFPELFGPNLHLQALNFWAQKLWFDAKVREEIRSGCRELRNAFGERQASREAAQAILETVYE
ncbi:MAG TPA: lipid-A-disaccharide synthase [Chlamydiales bacterium]|nr:lipid-A-disaccharide synthase [Chlamydiales bacterium]